MHLEEKYFGFEFSADYTQDHLGEGSALAIFQVINGKLEEVYHPCNNNGLEIGEEDTKKAIEHLKQIGAKELFSTFRLLIPAHNEEILGLTIGFDGSQDDEDDKTRYEYKGLYDDQDDNRENTLKEHGIELKKYNKENKM